MNKIIDKLFAGNFVIHIGFGDEKVISIALHPAETMLMGIVAGLGFIFGVGY